MHVNWIFPIYYHISYCKSYFAPIYNGRLQTQKGSDFGSQHT